MSTTIRMPGLVDPHVHLREPGAEHKEDFGTGTAAALAGGFTLILDMPNNPRPTIDAATLAEKRLLASKKIVCDVGFHLGGSADVFDSMRARSGTNARQVDGKIKAALSAYFAELAPMCYGLKLYLGETHGPLVFSPDRAEDERKQFIRIMLESWPEHSNGPVLLHATGNGLKEALEATANPANRRHICHISTADDLALFRRLKETGHNITAEVTPHHLFLTQATADGASLGAFAKVSPPLGTDKDVDALWAALNDGTIDMVATDHAPHSRAEKTGPNPPFGLPGLETALPLMLVAVAEGRISLERLIDAMSTAPRRIFNLPSAAEQQAEIDVELFSKDELIEISDAGLHTKAGWTPFAAAGLNAGGHVLRVALRGATVYEAGQVRAAPGSGRVLP